jgi:DNA-binding transcriptional LysR family regulator
MARVTTPPIARTVLKDWNLLRSLVAVVETGSLGQAAARLQITQPSISRHMRELERLLGETLFERRPSGMVASPRAQALYASVCGMQDLARQAESLLGDTPEKVSGLVRITTSQTFAGHVLPAWLAELMASEPGLDIELRGTEDVENLLRRDADVAVRFARPVQDGVIAQRIGQVFVGLYASSAYRTRCGVPSNMLQATQHVLIGSNAIAAGRGLGGLQLPSTLRFRLRTDSEQARLAAVETGMGIGPVQVHLALQRPDLQRVLTAEVNIPLELWLCGHDDLRRSARIRRVYDHLYARLTAQFGAAQQPGG